MNWLAIILATIANMVIGFLWYGTWAFGKSWMSLSGRQMGEGMNPGPLYALTIVAALVQAIAMSWFVGETGATSGSAGALVGLFAGLGLVATSMFANVLFAGNHPRLFAITAGYAVLVLVVQGMIIGFLGGA
ncbi:MAG TPA: DUF1761 domain-containing protein [Candidatus Limnocylindria bacterium]|nr:DUF1761 domain-containing protein [Candidatus Limnocylindria bacterium]